MYKASKNLTNSVKEHVDVIYEMTKEDYVGTFSSMKNHGLMKVLAEMVKRGVISKVRDGMKFRYMWVANSSPTPQFYLSIASTIGSHQRELDKSKRQSKKVAESAISPMVICKSLSDYSIQELWDELKSRNVVIENNHLVVIEKRVIA